MLVVTLTWIVINSITKYKGFFFFDKTSLHIVSMFIIFGE